LAYYKYGNILTQEDGAEFDTIYQTGTPTPYSGIYRCEGCGHSITSVHNHPFPPQNHHQHSAAQGTIRWRLAVKSHFRN
jgi:hypothetical protein